jgi:hypothetical protein
MLSLAAGALSGFESHVVPAVYAWGSAASSQQGWILQELMPAVPLDEVFDRMPMQEKKGMLAQMAKLLKALQTFQLPQTINSYGGVIFDDSGRIISAAMTSIGSGPWETYEAHFRERLERALERADGSPYLDGDGGMGLGSGLRRLLRGVLGCCLRG